MTVAHSPRFASHGRLTVIAALYLIVAPILISQPRSAVAQSDGDNAVAPTQAEPTEQHGQVDLRDIDFNDPLMISLVRVLSPPRDGADADPTVTFRRLFLDYQRSPDKLVIRDGTACQDAFAATINGYASLPAGELRFRGLIWPAYSMAPFGYPAPAAPQKTDAVTKARGLVPLLPLLPPNGLMALSYQVVGTADAPRLRINPFAVVYPGMLRRIVTICFPPDAKGG
jgi:hypothetical protein